MAIRVGDPIQRMRAAGPDPCGVLPAPISPSAAASAGGSLTGTIYWVATWFTPWGESLPSPEQLKAMGANGTLVISATAVPGATKMRAYFGQASGAEYQYQEVDFQTAGLYPGDLVEITITSSLISGASLPPRRSSAYLEDSDGSYVSSAVAFDWLNQALRQMVVQLGGIRDISGVAWPSQAAWAVLQNRWTEIENFWWSGWWQVVGKQSGTWFQSPIQSVPGYTSEWSNAGRDIVGLWPQPGQGPASTTLSSAINDSVTTIPVANAQTFTAPGLIKIDDEFILMSAQASDNLSFVGCIRGVSGTVVAAHAIDSPVTQLIAMFTGSRLAPDFSPGMSYALLQLPAGWDVPLDRFMLARYREKQQDQQSAAQLSQEFFQMVESLRSSKDAVPKNAQIGDARVFEAFAGYRTSWPFSILVP